MLRPFKMAPWAIALEVAMIARDRWTTLGPEARADLAAIVRKSKGRPQNLTARERERLMALVKELDLLDAGKRLLPFGGRRRRRH